MIIRPEDIEISKSYSRNYKTVAYKLFGKEVLHIHCSYRERQGWECKTWSSSRPDFYVRPFTKKAFLEKINMAARGEWLQKIVFDNIFRGEN
jgi:hypothetical protein